ncbi:MAG TPA: DUF2330 domain-containing protein [Fimbriimonadaceae bacterium]|nr:DUF2330 domain-containing protein [Fimbriimonadaceae bacterium]HRJ33789.1 DUF2330 domain-containing protein [Fimbriimonadaceae bacterium]
MSGQSRIHRFSIVALISVLSASAAACSGFVSAQNEIMFGRQVNLIIWDPDEKVQHFIRSASFEGSSREFGFIAPTPSVPELSEAQSDVFDILEVQRPRGSSIGCSKSEEAASTAGSTGVEVVQEVRVGDYDVKTLKATDASALAAYLKEHDYELPADQEQWVGHYVEKNWYLTTFQVRKDARTGALQTSAIRMTFVTERPFNPYYVPASNIGETPGGLKLYTLSPAPLKGTLEGEPWQRPEWSKRINEQVAQTVSEKVGLSPQAIPGNLVLSAYSDLEFPRANAPDISFVQAWAAEVKLPPSDLFFGSL